VGTVSGLIRVGRRLTNLRAFSGRTTDLGPILVVVAAALVTHSVVRYRPGLVLGYTLLAALLGISLWRSRTTRPPSTGAWALALVVAAAMAMRVHAFTYLSGTQASGVRQLTALTALATAALLVSGHRRAGALAVGAALTGYLLCAVLLVHEDPRPHIDVWVTLQQGSEGLFHGKDLYTQHWVGSPGMKNEFTYLPWTAVLVAPAWLVAHDVRWALIACTGLCAGIALALTGAGPRAWWRPGRSLIAEDLPRTPRAGTADEQAVDPRPAVPGPTPAGAGHGAAALLLLLPGTCTQVEQAWTEPLLLACLSLWAWAVHRGRSRTAVLALGLGLACKQHLVLVLVLAAAWRRFGVRKAAASALVAGVLVLPWVIASPGDMWHDTVSVLVNFPPIRFADTLYLLAMHEFGWQPPFWLTGAVVLAVLGTSCRALRHRDVDAVAVLRWIAFVLLVANLVNKQAFYNQYWLSIALVVMSWALPGTARPDGPEPDREATDSLSEARDRPAGVAA